MTVKELYEFAKEHGMEDCKIIISNNNDFEVGYDDEIIVICYRSEEHTSELQSRI